MGPAFITLFMLLQPAPQAVPPAALPSQDALHLPPTSLKPTGLAYDRVSARFVLVDQLDGKLLIADERSHHLVDLVDTASAGFHHITGLEIDQRRGDLWVVSINEGLDGNAPASVLHKLQLISGRPLKAFVLPATFGFARFEDVAVTRAGTVYVLDSIGGRLFSLSARGRRLARRINLVVDRPSSLAAVDERTVYIAHAEGISRLDVVTGRTTKVRAAEGTSLEGLERIRWYRGRLTGSQRLADGRQQAVVIRLAGAGHTGASLAVVGADGDLADPGAATMADGVLYFVTREVDSAGGSVLVVRGARLR